MAIGLKLLRHTPHFSTHSLFAVQLCPCKSFFIDFAWFIRMPPRSFLRCMPTVFLFPVLRFASCPSSPHMSFFFCWFVFSLLLPLLIAYTARSPPLCRQPQAPLPPCRFSLFALPSSVEFWVLRRQLLRKFPLSPHFAWLSHLLTSFFLSRSRRQCISPEYTIEVSPLFLFSRPATPFYLVLA